MTRHYRVYDRLDSGDTGQDCGVCDLESLPLRLRSAISADPAAGEWVLPALSEGDTGEELSGLQTVIRRA